MPNTATRSIYFGKVICQKVAIASVVVADHTSEYGFWTGNSTPPDSERRENSASRGGIVKEPTSGTVMLSRSAGTSVLGRFNNGWASAYLKVNV